MASSPTTRLDSIDAFRGFAILTMVLANYMAGINWIPAWLKHAPDVGLTIIDLIAPFFIFAIGLTLGLSFRRRQQTHGWRGAAGQLAIRYVAILGIGAILSAGQAAFVGPEGKMDWGVLQAIGSAGLLTLLVIALPKIPRLAIGLALLAGYQIMFNLSWSAMVLGSPHGGFFGALDWTAMMILGTVLADLFHDPHHGRQWFPWITLLTILAGVILAIWVPVSKNRVSASYVLISTGMSGIVFYLFYILTDKFKLHSAWLSAWGKNPLLLYLLHELLLGLVFFPPIPGWYAEAPLWLVILQAFALVGILSWIAYYLQKRHWIFAL
jgi:predicted acyltransferase